PSSTESALYTSAAIGCLMLRSSSSVGSGPKNPPATIPMSNAKPAIRTAPKPVRTTRNFFGIVNFRNHRVRRLNICIAQFNNEVNTNSVQCHAATLPDGCVYFTGSSNCQAFTFSLAVSMDDLL